MIKFSVEAQIFYSSDLSYQSLPDDLIDITNEQHMELLSKLNQGCVIFKDLRCSDPKPESYYVWNGEKWIDQRTDEEKRAAYLASLPSLSKLQFNLYLYDNNKYDEVQTVLNSNPRAKLAFDSIDKIVRTDSIVSTMIQALGWSEEEVDVMWEEALTL